MSFGMHLLSKLFTFGAVLGLSALIVSTNPVAALTAEQKAVRLQSALNLAHKIVQSALSNSEFMRAARPSLVKFGPRDMRETLESFRRDMPVKLAKTRIIYDGPYLRQECITTRFNAYVVLNGVDIYICDRAFEDLDDGLAENIIHEYVHTIGFQNGIYGECAATAVEMTAFTAAGYSPIGNGYISGGKCPRVESTLRDLVIELWPESERANHIQIGIEVKFSPTLFARIHEELKESTMLFDNAWGHVWFEVTPLAKGINQIFPPLKVTENKTEDGIYLIMRDSRGNFFQLVVAGSSTIPLRLSDLKKIGITFK